MGKKFVMRGLAAGAVLASAAGLLVGSAGSALADPPVNCGSHWVTDVFHRRHVYYHNCAYAAAIIDVNQTLAPTRQYCVEAKVDFDAGLEIDGVHDLSLDRVKLNHYLDGTYCNWRP